MAENDPDSLATTGTGSPLATPQSAPQGWRRKPPSAPYPKSRGIVQKSAEESLADYLAELEQWAGENWRDARRDAWAFWALKVPAIISSASAGVWAHLGWTTVTVISGAVASFCVAVDGIYPRGRLRNIHLRALSDIRALASDLTSKFRSSEGQPDDVVRQIIRESQSERQRIANYIRDAEAALGAVDTKVGKRSQPRQP